MKFSHSFTSECKRSVIRYTATSKNNGIQFLREKVRINIGGQLKVSVTRIGKENPGRSVQEWTGRGLRMGEGWSYVGVRGSTQAKYI